jgi:hypothetical protein
MRSKFSQSLQQSGSRHKEHEENKNTSCPLCDFVVIVVTLD